MGMSVEGTRMEGMETTTTIVEEEEGVATFFVMGWFC